MKVYVTKENARQEIDAQPGLSLMECLKQNGVYIPASCAGSMACSTCHVIVSPQWYSRLPEPTEDEEDVLDMLPKLMPTSRLSCQIQCREELSGLEVALPEEVHNLLSR